MLSWKLNQPCCLICKSSDDTPISPFKSDQKQSAVEIDCLLNSEVTVYIVPMDTNIEDCQSEVHCDHSTSLNINHEESTTTKASISEPAPSSQDCGYEICTSVTIEPNLLQNFNREMLSTTEIDQKDIAFDKSSNFNNHIHVEQNSNHLVYSTTLATNDEKLNISNNLLSETYDANSRLSIPQRSKTETILPKSWQLDMNNLINFNTKVHVVRLPHSLIDSKEPASKLDAIYANLTQDFFKQCTDYNHRHFPGNNQETQSNEELLSPHSTSRIQTSEQEQEQEQSDSHSGSDAEDIQCVESSSDLPMELNEIKKKNSSEHFGLYSDCRQLILNDDKEAENKDSYLIHGIKMETDDDGIVEMSKDDLITKEPQINESNKRKLEFVHQSTLKENKLLDKEENLEKMQISKRIKVGHLELSAIEAIESERLLNESVPGRTSELKFKCQMKDEKSLIISIKSDPIKAELPIHEEEVRFNKRAKHQIIDLTLDESEDGSTKPTSQEQKFEREKRFAEPMCVSNDSSNRMKSLLLESESSVSESNHCPAKAATTTLDKSNPETAVKSKQVSWTLSSYKIPRLSSKPSTFVNLLSSNEKPSDQNQQISQSVSFTSKVLETKTQSEIITSSLVTGKKQLNRTDNPQNFQNQQGPVYLPTFAFLLDPRIKQFATSDQSPLHRTEKELQSKSESVLANTLVPQNLPLATLQEVNSNLIPRPYHSDNVGKMNQFILMEQNKRRFEALQSVNTVSSSAIFRSNYQPTLSWSPFIEFLLKANISLNQSLSSPMATSTLPLRLDHVHGCKTNPVTHIFNSELQKIIGNATKLSQDLPSTSILGVNEKKIEILDSSKRSQFDFTEKIYQDQQIKQQRSVEVTNVQPPTIKNLKDQDSYGLISTNWLDASQIKVPSVILVRLMNYGQFQNGTETAMAFKLMYENIGKYKYKIDDLKCDENCLAVFVESHEIRSRVLAHFEELNESEKYKRNGLRFIARLVNLKNPIIQFQPVSSKSKKINLSKFLANIKKWNNWNSEVRFIKAKVIDSKLKISISVDSKIRDEIEVKNGMISYGDAKVSVIDDFGLIQCSNCLDYGHNCCYENKRCRFCGKDHENVCSVKLNPDQWFCHLCNVHGHSSLSKNCPALIEQLKLKLKDIDHKYNYIFLPNDRFC